ELRALDDQRLTVFQAGQARAERWRVICPPGFLDSDPGRLPQPEKLKDALEWRYGPQGLLLHGPTGSGKSRVAWLVLKREWEAGRTVASLDSLSGLTYASKYSESAQEVGRWIDRLCGIDLLLLDDVFKAKLTDSFEGSLFAVINRRTERKLPLLVTLN